MAILGIGLALLGVTSLRANILPRWRGLPLGLGLLSILYGMVIWLVYYVPLSQGHFLWTWGMPFTFGMFVHLAVLLLLGPGWIGLGTMLATEANSDITQSPPASA